MLTKHEIEEDRLRNAEKWEKYFDGNDVDMSLRESAKDKPEFYYEVSKGELDRLELLNRWLLVDIDELTEIKIGRLTFKLPDDFGSDQNNTFHQSVSGVVVKDSGDIKAGTRIFFHYLSIINAKIRQSGGGLILLCEGKSYLLLDRKTMYVGMLDGELLALHPDFCITEAVEREHVISARGLVMDKSGLVEKELEAKPYDPFRCRIVALPSTIGMEEDRLRAMVRVSAQDGVLIPQALEEGQLVQCRKAWDIPVDNSIQKYFGDRRLFRTRIEAIKQITNG